MTQGVLGHEVMEIETVDIHLCLIGHDIGIHLRFCLHATLTLAKHHPQIVMWTIDNGLGIKRDTRGDAVAGGDGTGE